jgi:hypothetical protein
MKKAIQTICCVVIVFANAAWSLTEGPAQPEYFSFEPVDATDVVNVPTGNMTYVIPVGDVKTPENVGYPIALSYHAGITNEQEATWVGLGWTLNVGSINRTVVGYPDDYAGDSYVSQIHSTGDKGIDVTVAPQYENGGTISSSFAWRYSASSGNIHFLGYMGTDLSTPTGAYAHLGAPNRGGQSSFGVGYEMKMGNAGSIGVGYTWDNTPGWDSYVSMQYGPVGMSIDAEGNASVSVSFSVKNFSFSLGMSSNQSKAQGYTNKSITVSGTGSYNMGYGGTVGLKIAPTFWKWTFNQVSLGRAWGFLYQSPQTTYTLETDNPMFNNEHRDQTLLPTEFAPVYRQPNDGPPGELPEDFEPAGVFVKQAADKLEYVNDDEFNFGAGDIYSMAAQGVGGVIKPYVNKAMTTCFSKEGDIAGLIGVPKAGWRGRLNQMTDDIDTYFNFNGNSAALKSVMITSKFHQENSIVFKLAGESGYNLIDGLSGVSYEDGTDIIPADEFGLVDNTVKNVVCGTKITPIIGMDRDFMKKLNGFVVTDQQGKNFYFTEPLYSLQKAGYVNENKNFPNDITESNINFNEDLGAFATTWLLTAVTGPDYVKMNSSLIENTIENRIENSLPHTGDWGYWVRFRYEYGDEITEVAGMPQLSPAEDASQAIKKGTYSWRTPYWDRFSADDKKYHEQNPCLKDYTNVMKKAKYSSSFGRKEITYLKSIESASEIAFFRTSERLDGFGIEYNVDADASENDYPKLGKYVLANSPFSGAPPNNTELGFPAILPPPYCHDRVKNFPSAVPLITEVMVGGDEIDLTKCAKVTVPDGSGLDASFYSSSLPEGTEIINIDLTATKNFHRIAPHPIPFYKLDISEGSKSDKLIVIKNEEGWKMKDGTTNRMVHDESVPIDYAKGSTLKSTRGRQHFEIPLSPIDDLAIPFQSKFTNYAKCIHAEHNVNGWTFYIVGYNGKIKRPNGLLDWNLRTGLTFGNEYIVSRNISMYSLSGISSIRHVVTYVTDGTWKRYETRNPTVRYVKKLNEIAWYSKTKYPYLTGESDPYLRPIDMQGVNPQEYGYPESYKRVKFRYNYELAQGTPNSKSNGVKLDDAGKIIQGGYGGGRLTLKEMRQEWGPEDFPTIVPPYLFEYQGAAKKYGFGYESIDDPSTSYEDEWGFPKEPHENVNSATHGIYWNLSSVLLPSCGRLNFNYERDYVNSPYGTLCAMKRDQYCVSSKTNYEYSYYRGNYYTFKNITSSTISDAATLTLENTEGLAPGMFALIQFSNYAGSPFGSDDKHAQTNYTYEITGISGNSVTLNKPVGGDVPTSVGGDVPDGCIAARLAVINNSPLFCGDVRVTDISLNNGMGSTVRTHYNYPQGGVIRSLPPKALPELFFKKEQIFEAEAIKTRLCNKVTNDIKKSEKKWEKPGFSGSGYVEMSGDPQSSIKFSNLPIDETGDFYMLIRYSCEENAKREIQGYLEWLGDDDVDFPNTNGQWDTLYFPFKVPEKWVNENDDPIVNLCIDNRVGDSRFGKTILVDWIALRCKHQATVIDSRPIDFGLYHDMIFGGAGSVIYPVVEVYNAANDGAPLSGKTRYNFFTHNDKVDIDGNGTLKPMVEEVKGRTTDGVKVVQYIDRSGLAGKEKLVQYVNNSGRVVGWKRPKYCFADYLNSNYGVCDGLDRKLSNSQPLGVMRERMKRMETSIDLTPDAGSAAFRLAAISDMITLPAYNVGLETSSDGHITSTHNYLFDAFTGTPLVTVASSKKPDGSQVNKVNAAIPYLFLVGTTERAWHFAKNIFTHEGISITAKSNTASFTPPNTVQDIIDESNEGSDGDYSIVGATAQGWSKKTWPGTSAVPFEQSFTFKDTSFVWQGGIDFGCAPKTLPGWLVKERVLSVDDFARTIMASDAVQTKFCTITHPYFPSIIAKIDNADIGECGVYTCDYRDYPQLSTSDFSGDNDDKWHDNGMLDARNGWAKGVGNDAGTPGKVELVSYKTHFGQKCLYVEDSWGPTKNFKATPNRNYFVSAWVNVTAGTLKIVAEYRDGAGNILFPSVLKTVPANTGEWQLARLDIPGKNPGAATDLIIRVWIGNNCNPNDAENLRNVKACMDDIRFAPADAHIASFYYDQNKGVPITFVDLNDNAKYFKYDNLGRLAEKGLIRQ